MIQEHQQLVENADYHLLISSSLFYDFDKNILIMMGLELPKLVTDVYRISVFEIILATLLHRKQCMCMCCLSQMGSGQNID